MDLQNEIDAFIAKYTKMWFYESLAASYKHNPLLDYTIDKDGSVFWHKVQTAEAWDWWQSAKAYAVPSLIDIQVIPPNAGQKVVVFRPHAHEKPFEDPNFKICTYVGEGIFINSHFEHEITHWFPLISPVQDQ